MSACVWRGDVSERGRNERGSSRRCRGGRQASGEPLTLYINHPRRHQLVTDYDTLMKARGKSFHVSNSLTFQLFDYTSFPFLTVVVFDSTVVKPFLFHPKSAHIVLTPLHYSTNVITKTIRIVPKLFVVFVQTKWKKKLNGAQTRLPAERTSTRCRNDVGHTQLPVKLLLRVL